MQQNKEGAWIGEFTNLAGAPVLGSLRRIDATGWYMVVEVLQTEAYSPSQNSLLTIVIVTALLGIAVMSGNSIFMRRFIFNPLQRLSAGAVRLGQGDLRHRIITRRHDEIGAITTAFNEMADAIEHRNTEILEKNQALTEEIASHRLTQEQLQQLNLSLEERIVRRTHDLEMLTADLLRSNKELQEFAYIASHDLQEPLRKVRSFGDRLSAHSATQLDDMSKDYLARMQSAAARMQALIEALLAYSRVTTKAQPATPVDLRVTAAEVLSDLETQIERQQGIVTLGNLDVVPADPLQMHQLLQNLIGNALKFHRPETAPAVHVAGRWLSADEAEHIAGVEFGPNAGVYELSVTDNGIGIDPQYFDRIFQMFQRLHGRNEYEGTGVGLAICRKIVERHNGAIVVRSQPEEGTSFVVLWPVTARPDAQSHPDQAQREWIR
jgi:signal transduction histidine kinase